MCLLLSYSLLSDLMLLCRFLILHRHIVLVLNRTSHISGKASPRSHCSQIDKYCMAAECLVAVIKANRMLAISNRERGIVKSTATHIIYCRHLDLAHPETLVFNRCIPTGYLGFSCSLQKKFFIFSFFFFPLMHSLWAKEDFYTSFGLYV